MSYVPFVRVSTIYRAVVGRDRAVVARETTTRADVDRESVQRARARRLERRCRSRAFVRRERRVVVDEETPSSEDTLVHRRRDDARGADAGERGGARGDGAETERWER